MVRTQLAISFHVLKLFQACRVMFLSYASWIAPSPLPGITLLTDACLLMKESSSALVSWKFPLLCGSCSKYQYPSMPGSKVWFQSCFVVRKLQKKIFLQNSAHFQSLPRTKTNQIQLVLIQSLFPMQFHFEKASLSFLAKLGPTHSFLQQL